MAPDPAALLSHGPLRRRGGQLAPSRRVVYVRVLRTRLSSFAVRKRAVDGQLAATVGRRICRLRIQSGLGSREQARALGVSPSSLSDVENSRGGMSLPAFSGWRIASGAHHRSPRGGRREPGRRRGGRSHPYLCCKVPGAWRGHGVLYQLLEGHAIQPYLLSFEPGGTYEDDKIAHPGEEFAYVLLGQELLIDAEVHRLTESDVVRFRTDRAHAFRNTSLTGMAVVVGAATPPW
jgi:hypothetical protein